MAKSNKKSTNYRRPQVAKKGASSNNKKKTNTPKPSSVTKKVEVKSDNKKPITPKPSSVTKKVEVKSDNKKPITPKPSSATKKVEVKSDNKKPITPKPSSATKKVEVKSDNKKPITPKSSPAIKKVEVKEENIAPKHASVIEKVEVKEEKQDITPKHAPAIEKVEVKEDNAPKHAPVIEEVEVKEDKEDITPKFSPVIEKTEVKKVKRRRLKIKPVLMLLVIIAVVVSLFAFMLERNKYENKAIKLNLDQTIIKSVPRRMSLVAVGDALLHAGVYLDGYVGNGNYDFHHMFTYLEPIIKNYDLRYYNQETIIGGKDLGITHYPLFNSPDEIGSDLVDMGFNMVSLATNHSLDKGERGILHSVEFWRSQEGVIAAGQSDSFENRDNIPVYEKNGIKFAFLSYTNETNGIPVPWGKEYLLNVYSDEQAKKDIDSIKDKVDVIIVAMHWGTEYTSVPTYEQRRQAEYLSSLGVNLIIGCHPHVIQPVEYVGDTLVIYSLGNLISSQHPLGLDKIIGLMVGLDISVYDDKVVIENVDYKLLYTYCTASYTNYSIIPFENLTDNILYNYKNIEQEYMKIVKGE